MRNVIFTSWSVSQERERERERERACVLAKSLDFAPFYIRVVSDIIRIIIYCISRSWLPSVHDVPFRSYSFIASSHHHSCHADEINSTEYDRDVALSRSMPVCLSVCFCLSVSVWCATCTCSRLLRVFLNVFAFNWVCLFLSRHWRYV